MKLHDPKQAGEERVYLTYTSTLLFTTGRSQDRNSSRTRSWGQELIQRPWRSAAYWLALYGLLNLLSYRTEDHQSRDGTTHNGLGHLLRKTYTAFLNLIIWRHSFLLFLFFFVVVVVVVVVIFFVLFCFAFVFQDRVSL
jgi:fatty acid desaturase